MIVDRPPFCQDLCVVDITFRYEVQKSDLQSVRHLAEMAGVFNQAEVGIAAELVQTRLEKGDASGYFFVLAEMASRLAGYTCYGPIPATDGRYEIYWIVVDPAQQRRGLGGRILLETEKQIVAAQGKRVYVETSSCSDYQAAHAFYCKHGYHLEARLAKYHRDDDDLCIYLKLLI